MFFSKGGSGRLKIVAVLAVAVLTVGVVAAYGALGGQDTATGTGALAAENGGNFNTADGFLALTANTIGTGNTAVGYVAMLSNTTGGYNTATGNGVLGSNTSGTDPPTPTTCRCRSWTPRSTAERRLQQHHPGRPARPPGHRQEGHEALALLQGRHLEDARNRQEVAVSRQVHWKDLPCVSGFRPV